MSQREGELPAYLRPHDVPPTTPIRPRRPAAVDFDEQQRANNIEAQGQRIVADMDNLVSEFNRRDPPPMAPPLQLIARALLALSYGDFIEMVAGIQAGQPYPYRPDGSKDAGDTVAGPPRDLATLLHEWAKKNAER